MVAITVATNVTIRTGAQGLPGIPGTAAPHAADHEVGGTDVVTVEDLATAGTSGQVPTSDGAGALTMETPATVITAHSGLTGLTPGDAGHTDLQLRSEKDQASGYAGLDSGTLLDGAQVPYGSASDTATEGNDSRVPTQGENDALVGTNGTPATGNPYVTDSDPRNTDARTPTSHTIVSHDTTATGANLNTLTGGGDADSQHTHSALQLRSEKDSASGYAGLSAGSKLSGTQQTYGAIADTAAEGDDARLSDARTPTGSASGDLSASYPGPTVAGIQGESVSATTPTEGQVLVHTGGVWTPQAAPSGGASLGEVWSFDDSTTMADPGGGNFRMNNTTQGSATLLAISNESKTGLDFSNILARLGLDDFIYIQTGDDASEFVLYRVTADAVDNTSWLQVPVTSDNSGSEITDGVECGLVLLFAGGVSGSGDVVGPAGGVVDGEIALYDSITGKLIKGSSGAVLGDFVADADLIDSSAGVGDAGKPIKLDAAGVLDSTIAEPPGSIATHAALPNAHHDELHAATHSDGGSDEIVIADLASTGIDGAVAIADGSGGLEMSHAVIQNSKTGLVDQLTNLISINAGDPAKVDIRASQGVVINFDPDPTDPTMVDLVWAVPFTAITLPNLATEIATSVFVVDGGGGTPVIELTNAFPTSEELRTKLFVGAAIHGGTSVVDAVVSTGITAFDTGSSLDDLFVAVGDRSLSGNLYAANSGGNLLLDKGSGVAFGRGLNPSNINNPHNLNTSLQTAIGLYTYSFQNATSGFNTSNESTIDPDFYDDGSGTLATTSNKYTIQRLIFSPRAGGVTAVEYGQTLYNSQNDAIDGITANGIVKNPAFDQSILRGWLVVQGGTTDLTNTSDAAFRENITEVAQPSGAGTDVNAIHVNGANEISSITTKATVVAGDLLVIEDSASGNIKKSVPFSSLDARYAELTGATFTGNVEVESAAPQFILNETDAGSDEKQWRFISIAGTYSLTTFTDAGSAGSDAIAWTRTGTSVDLCTIDTKLTVTDDLTISNNGHLDVTGEFRSATADFTGPITVERNVPYFRLKESDGPVDAQDWRFRSSNGRFLFSTYDDVGNGALGEDALMFDRTGTVVDLCTIATTLLVTGEASAATPTVGGSLTTKDYVDALVQGVEWQDSVFDRDLTAPPGSPTTGDRYIPASVATGDWATHEDDITEWDGAAWTFVVPTLGMTVAVDDETRNLRWNGSAWVFFGTTVDHVNLASLTVGDAGHTQLQLRSEKNSANGYAGLSAGTLIDGSQVLYGTGSDTACEGDDSRLSDARTPTTHGLGGSEHSSATLAQLNALVSDATLDTSTATRPPSGTAGGDLGGTYPNPTVDDGADGTAIHDNVNSEISVLTDKAVPVGGDFLIIEDSAASNAKKRINISNLPASTPVFGSEYVSVSTASTTQDNSETYQSHLRLPASGTITFPSGTYRIEVQYIWEADPSFNGRLEEDGVLVGAEHTTSRSDGDDALRSYVEERTLNGAHDFELLVKSADGGAARMKAASLTVWRVS